jgi:uncharacterized protein YllA (UPF0747 family)
MAKDLEIIKMAAVNLIFSEGSISVGAEMHKNAFLEEDKQKAFELLSDLVELINRKMEKDTGKKAIKTEHNPETVFNKPSTFKEEVEKFERTMKDVAESINKAEGPLN